LKYFAAALVLAAAKNLEDQPVAFFAVFPEQRLDVLERRRLERLEPVPLVDVADDANHIFAPADVGREKVPGASGRLNVAGCQVWTMVLDRLEGRQPSL
jgi:hypothetical protein